MVQSRAWARMALDAGADILVAQGTEAGGHTGNVGTLPLLQIVLDLTDKPVLAAGGIATGRGIAAVLAAGAAGAWIGTPFLVARESRSPKSRARTYSRKRRNANHQDARLRPFARVNRGRTSLRAARSTIRLRRTGTGGKTS